MIESIKGIIIKEKSYSETSKIIDVITKEHGIISILAKGAKTLKSPLRSSSTKLTYGNFNIVYKEGKLSTLKEIDVINYAICSGIKGIFTAHGSSLEEISINPMLKQLLNLHVFERIIFLSDKKRKAEIECVYCLNKKTSQYCALW